VITFTSPDGTGPDLQFTRITYAGQESGEEFCLYRATFAAAKPGGPCGYGATLPQAAAALNNVAAALAPASGGTGSSTVIPGGPW
jgi:hypothetical protein